MPETLDDDVGEVAPEVTLEVGVVGKVRVEDRRLETELRVREQHRQLGSGHADAGAHPLRHLLARRQLLDRPVEHPFGLERRHQFLVGADPRCGRGHLLGQDLRLQVVVVEDVPHDVLADLREQLVPLLARQVAARLRDPEQDLEVDLVVGAVDAAGVVDEVGIDPPACPRILDPTPLGEAQIAALADDEGPHLAPGYAEGVVRSIARVGVVLVGGPDVRADAAVPEQVDRGAQDGAYELRRGERPLLDRERCRGLRRYLDALRAFAARRRRRAR